VENNQKEDRTMIGRLLSKIFGLLLILIGLWCFIFVFLIIFNLLPYFNKHAAFDNIKDLIAWPYNARLFGRWAATGHVLDWEHFSGSDKIIHSIVATGIGVLFVFTGWASWTAVDEEN
jgi:hypothetical protein